MILTVGDKKPSLVYYLKRGGRALDLSSANSVTVVFTFSDGTSVEQAATVSDAASGKITVPLTDGGDASILTVVGELTIDPVIHWTDAADDQHAEQPDVIVVRAEGQVA